MTDTLAEVVTLYDTNARDIVASIRKLADDIEAGDYGDVREVALAMAGDKLHVFGWGPEQDGATTQLLLVCGAQKLVKAVIDELG